MRQLIRDEIIQERGKGGDLDLLNEKKLNRARPKQSQSTSPGERDTRVHIEFIGASISLQLAHAPT